MSENNKVFSMNYNTEGNTEITKIKEKYLNATAPKSDIEKLKELDRKAEIPGQVVSLILGLIGILIFGTGMSLVLVDNSIFTGIIWGILGICLMIPAYPVYNLLTKRSRERISPQVLELIEKISDSPAK